MKVCSKKANKKEDLGNNEQQKTKTKRALHHTGMTALEGRLQNNIREPEKNTKQETAKT